MKDQLLYLVLIILFYLLPSCDSSLEDRNKVIDSTVTNLGTLDKLNLIIIYSDYSNLDDAKREASRTLGCSKSSINRLLENETQPTELMQNEINNVFQGILHKKSLKSMDKTMNFWQKYVLFWHRPDTTDIYHNTINPLYEVKL